MLKEIKLNLAENFRDKEYFDEFFRVRVGDEISGGVIALRRKRGMNQGQLAAEAKMKQSAVSRIESTDYDGWTVKTLLRIASALDARLVVRFEPREKVIKKSERNK